MHIYSSKNKETWRIPYDNKKNEILHMKKIIYILFFALSFSIAKAQQDPQYSQYMFNHVVINPGYTGSKDALSTTLQMRKQWVGIDGSPQTNDFSIHGPLKSKNIGLGGHIVLEQIGPKRWISGYGDFAYHIKIGKGKLGLGVSAGMISYQYDFSKITYNTSELASTTIGELNRNKTSFDANFGAYYRTNAMFIGYGITHITEPKLYQITTGGTINPTTFNFNAKRHHFITIGRGFRLSDNVIFSPSILIKSLEMAGGQNIDVNFNFLLAKKLWLGTSVRSSKNVIVLAQYLINPKFKIGYSFDYVYGGISKGRNNSHEIMLGYNFSSAKSHIISPRYL